MFEVMHFQDILTEAKFRLKTYGFYIHDDEPGTIGDSVQEQMNYLETTCNELFGIEVASVSDEVHTRYFPLADVESIFYCSAPSLATTWHLYLGLSIWMVDLDLRLGVLDFRSGFSIWIVDLDF